MANILNSLLHFDVLRKKSKIFLKYKRLEKFFDAIQAADNVLIGYAADMSLTTLEPFSSFIEQEVKTISRKLLEHIFHAHVICSK